MINKNVIHILLLGCIHIEEAHEMQITFKNNILS